MSICFICFIVSKSTISISSYPLLHMRTIGYSTQGTDISVFRHLLSHTLSLLLGNGRYRSYNGCRDPAIPASRSLIESLSEDSFFHRVRIHYRNQKPETFRNGETSNKTPGSPDCSTIFPQRLFSFSETAGRNEYH